MKPIAGPNIEPFGLGGFCVTGANIDGVNYTSLNIYQQRSSVMFDLIDGNGDIHQFIQLVHVDADMQLLDPDEDTSTLLGKIAKNTFFIKTIDPDSQENTFVFQYHTNLIKLSNGVISFKPWEYINFCNATDENQINKVDGTTSTLTAEPTSVPADGQTESTVTLTVRDDTGAILDAIDSGVVFTATGLDAGKFVVSAVDYSQKSLGIITVTVKAIEGGTLTISAKVGSVNITQTAQINFTGSGLDVVDPATSSITATSPVIANFMSTSLITITLKDSYGNPITDIHSAFVNFTLSTFTDQTDYEWGTFDETNSANGIYTITLKSKKALTTKVTAVVRGITLTQEPEIVFSLSNAPSPGGITLTSSKRTVNISTSSPSAAASTTTLTLTVKDQYGNPVDNLSSNVTLGIINEFDATRYTISPIDTTNASTGVYTFTMYSREAADVLVYPIIPALGSLTNITAPIDFTYVGTHGEIGTPVEGKSFTQVTDQPIIADGLNDTEVVIYLVTANDKICNNVTGVTPNKLTITQFSGVTISGLDYRWAGVGMITCRVKSTIPGDYTFKVYSNNVLITGFALKFIAGPVSDGKTTFTASPLTAKINGTGNEKLSTFTIAKKDIVGNPLPITAEEISISATGFNSTADYTISNWSINGNVANATVTSKMAVTGTFTATLGDTVITQKPSVKFYWDDLTGNTGPVDPTLIDFFRDTAEIDDDGISSAGIYAWMYSAGKLPTAGIMASEIEFFVVSPALSASEYSFTPVVDTEESYARGGSFSTRFKCTKGGITAVIGMKYNGAVMPHQVSIKVNQTVIISPTKSTLFATTPVDNAGVGRFSDIVFYPRDDAAATIKSLTEGKVEFKCSDPAAVFTYDYSKSSTDGVIRGTMECPNVGVVDVTAVVGAVTVGPVQVDIKDWTIPDAFNSYMEATTPAIVGGSNLSMVNLFVRNYNGNPVVLDSGIKVNIVGSVGGTTASLANEVSYARKDEGMYTFTVKSSEAQQAFVTATASDIKLNAQATIDFVDGSPVDAVSIALCPQIVTAVAGEDFELEALFTGQGSSTAVKTGVWSVSTPSAVHVLSNSGNKFKGTALAAGTYTIKFIADYNVSVMYQATLYIINSTVFRSATIGMEFTNNLLPYTTNNVGVMPDGMPINAGTEAVIKILYSPSTYVPTGPVEFSILTYSPATGNSSITTVLPFTVIGTPDNIHFYIRFDKKVYGAFEITVNSGANTSFNGYKSSSTFKVILLNPDGIYKPELTLTPKFNDSTFGGVIKTGETIGTSIVAQWAWGNTPDMSKMARMPYVHEVEYTSSNPAVATFDSEGNVTGLTEGTTQLSAKYKDYPVKYTTLKVGPNYPTRVLGYKPDNMIVPSYHVATKAEPITFPAGSTTFDMIPKTPGNSGYTINPDNSVTVTSVATVSIPVIPDYSTAFPVGLVGASTEVDLRPPAAVGKPIVMQSLSIAKVNLPFRKSGGNTLYYVGDILKISSALKSSYGWVYEDYVCTIEDPSVLELYKPYYYDAPLNYMNDTLMYRAKKAGVCTVTVHYPKLNRTISYDVVVTDIAPVSPYPPSGN